jgi:NADH:ubiquinone reductase (H+-translocating)
LDDNKYPKGHPQLAQVAIQQGKQLAANFKRSLKSKEWKPFVYKDKGTMAIISKFKAVADLPDISFKGFLAWIVWLFVHLLPIASFRNKVSLILDWTWAFLTNDPTLRLIIRPSSKEFAKENASATPSPIQEKGKMVSPKP